MMGLSILDWVILLIIVLSVLQAIAQGFFYEFFSLGGRDRRISVGCMGVPAGGGVVCASRELPVGGGYRWVLYHIFCCLVAGRSAWTDCALGRARCWTSLVRPSPGRSIWVSARGGGQHGRRAGAGRVCAAVGMVAAVADCAFYAGEWPCFDLGGAGGVATALP